MLADCGGGLFGVYEVSLGQDIGLWYSTSTGHVERLEMKTVVEDEGGGRS